MDNHKMLNLDMDNQWCLESDNQCLESDSQCPDTANRKWDSHHKWDNLLEPTELLTLQVCNLKDKIHTLPNTKTNKEDSENINRSEIEKDYANR